MLGLSRLSLRLSFRGAVALAAGTAFLLACSSSESTGKKKKTPAVPGDDYYNDPPAEEQPIEGTVNPDSGAFGAGSRPSTKDGGGSLADGGTGPTVYCDGPLQAGDLAIVEIMVSSHAGSGDDGEWVEVRNTRTCTLKLQGVTVDSTRGQAAPDIAAIADDLEVPPNGTFVVVGSDAWAKSHGVQGAVFAWNTTDVLKNDGDTISVKAGATVLDELTYPAFDNLTPGRALAFPDDCAWSIRKDWTRWSLTFTEFSTGFKGTPNATNGDVACY